MESIKISNGSKRRCAQTFPYKGIWKTIAWATKYIEVDGVQPAIGECIYDHDSDEDYNVMLFLLKENVTDPDTIRELSKFSFIENPRDDAEIASWCSMRKKELLTAMRRKGECKPSEIPMYLKSWFK